MTLEYPFRLWHQDDVVYAQGIAPFDNVLTYGADEDMALDAACEALTGVLGAMLDAGVDIPSPPGKGADGIHLVAPSPRVAWPAMLRLERERAHLSQAELARRLGITFQAVQKWERSGSNPTLGTADRVLRALGRRFALLDR